MKDRARECNPDGAQPRSWSASWRCCTGNSSRWRSWMRLRLRRATARLCWWHSGRGSSRWSPLAGARPAGRKG